MTRGPTEALSPAASFSEVAVELTRSQGQGFPNTYRYDALDVVITCFESVLLDPGTDQSYSQAAT
jgi:hypothetical protein